MGCVTYAVSAVYVAVGESGLSEPLNLGGSGIEQVSDKALSTVSAGRGVIVVANADGADVRVTDMAGSGDCILPVEPGVWKSLLRPASTS